MKVVKKMEVRYVFGRPAVHVVLEDEMGEQDVWLSREKLRVLADIRKAEVDGVKVRQFGALWSVFRNSNHFNSYSNYWYRHAHELVEMGAIYFDGMEYMWRLTEIAKVILAFAVANEVVVDYNLKQLQLLDYQNFAEPISS